MTTTRTARSLASDRLSGRAAPSARPSRFSLPAGLALPCLPALPPPASLQLLASPAGPAVPLRPPASPAGSAGPAASLYPLQIFVSWMQLLAEFCFLAANRASRAYKSGFEALFAVNFLISGNKILQTRRKPGANPGLGSTSPAPGQGWATQRQARQGCRPRPDQRKPAQRSLTTAGCGSARCDAGGALRTPRRSAAAQCRPNRGPRK